MTNSTEIVSKNIKFYRDVSSYTQEELSELSSITPKYLSEIERGIKVPSIGCLEKIANALNIEMYQIFL